jgi:hypothetical protein
MRFDPDKHHRRSIRLKGHDYAQPGAYFVTVCTHGRMSLFDHVVNGEVRLNDAGEIARVVGRISRTISRSLNWTPLLSCPITYTALS